MNIDTIHVYISLSSYKKHHLPVLKNTTITKYRFTVFMSVLVIKSSLLWFARELRK